MDRKYSDPTIWDNSIDHDDEPDGSDGGYTKHGSFIVAPAMRELVRLRAELAECKRISGARKAHIERLCHRNTFQCAASGCPGCAVCDPVAALAAEGEKNDV